MAIKIIIADDHRLIRDGIKSYLEDDPEFKIIGEAENGEETLEKVRSKQPNLVLMDINMDKINGIDCTKKIKAEFPYIKILALTMLKESQHIREMIRSGASGYLLKDCDEDEIKDAIKKACNGEMVYSKEVSASIMSGLNEHLSSVQETTQKTIPLTNREREVLNLIIDEHNNSEIAEKLFISVRTVDAHKRNLLEKTGSKNIAGLVRFAIENGLYDKQH